MNKTSKFYHPRGDESGLLLELLSRLSVASVHQPDFLANIRVQFGIGGKQLKHSLFSNQTSHKEEIAAGQTQFLAVCLGIPVNRGRGCGEQAIVYGIRRRKDCVVLDLVGKKILAS